MLKWSIITVGFALIVFLVASGGAAVTGPPAPVNLEVVDATETSVTIAWGPSPPGDFTPGVENKKNTVTIGWGPSEDSRSAVTYTLKKDGTTIATGLSNPSYTVTGVGPKVKSFRTCVTAFNTRGQASPETCGTYTRA